MSKISETKEKILDISKKEICKKGFNYFSYQDISEILGIKKSSIHYHFPSKNILGIAILDKYIYDFGMLINETKEKSPKEKLKLFFEVLKYFSKTKDSICPSGVFSADFYTLDEELKLKLNIFFNIQKNWLIQIILQGKKDGAFKSNIDENSFVLLVMSSIQGAIQICRTTQNENIFDLVVSQLEEFLIS